MSLLYEDRTEILRRCFFHVQNEVGLGRREEAYHQACAICFKQVGVPFRSKAPHHLLLDGEVAHTLVPDFVVWDAMTVELKALPRKLTSYDFVQLFDYLKYRQDRLGLLVNMGLDRVHVERIVFAPPEYELKEDWYYWSGQIGHQDREVGAEVREAVRTIYETYQTGYGNDVTRALILSELSRRGLNVVIAPNSESYFRGHQMAESRLDCLVIEGRIVFVHTALYESNQFNISRGLSYMGALDLHWGIAANFGKRVAEFTGLRSGV